MLEKELRTRSNNTCELCASMENLQVHVVAPKEGNYAEECVLTCSTCLSQIENSDTTDENHWRCLNDSIWSPEPAVQVVAWRMLHQLTSKGIDWSQGLMDMMYMEEETANWAKALVVAAENAVIHKDSNGVILNAGDSVVLIKDLNVKGATFTAKRGTAVRRISLVQDNPEHIEGRINGQHIVILTKYVKKSK
ncbi:MAG: PhnA domain-containing protein [Saprospiraceae bacterium]